MTRDLKTATNKTVANMTVGKVGYVFVRLRLEFLDLELSGYNWRIMAPTT